MPRITTKQAGGANVCAFLDMIAISELGAGLLKHSDDGYDVLVGATERAPLLFPSYATHPAVYNARYRSTAAGRYQLLSRYFAAYKAQLALPDFGPLSQDRIAIQQMSERHALVMVQSGHFDEAVDSCSSCWVSLPGATAGQHVNEMAPLRAAYIAAGGTIA